MTQSTLSPAAVSPAFIRIHVSADALLPSQGLLTMDELCSRYVSDVEAAYPGADVTVIRDGQDWATVLDKDGTPLCDVAEHVQDIKGRAWMEMLEEEEARVMDL